MLHRHLREGGLTLAAIDDIVVRGRLDDWLGLRAALRADPALAGRALEMFRRRQSDAGASQRYSFWVHYAARLTTHSSQGNPRDGKAANPCYLRAPSSQQGRA